MKRAEPFSYIDSNKVDIFKQQWFYLEVHVCTMWSLKEISKKELYL